MTSCTMDQREFQNLLQIYLQTLREGAIPLEHQTGP